MRQLVHAATAAALVSIAIAGCDDRIYKPLGAFAPASAEALLDVGVPLEPYSTDQRLPGLSLSLSYHDNPCFSLDDSAYGAVDGKRAEYFDPGGLADGSKDGSGEYYCISPGFTLDQLPEARDTSVITLADDSDEWSIVVDRLIVNPEITVGALHPGQETIATVDDTRAFEVYNIWFRPEFNDPNPTYWYQVQRTVVGNQIHFTVPSNAHGTGTLGIVLKFTNPPVDCVGFESCTVTIRGGASFDATVQ